MPTATDPERSVPPVGWGTWLAWTWVGVLLLCALATALRWDDLGLALDLVRDLR